MPDVVVIGAGLNGLVASAVLARHKVSTLLLEQRPVVGGAAVTTEIAAGFHVPQLSHSLGPIRGDVARVLRLDRVAGFEFLTADPSLTSLGRNEQAIAFHPDPILTAGTINRLSGRDAGRWREFVNVTQRVGRVITALQARAAPAVDSASWPERWHMLQAARRARGLGRRDLTRLVRWASMPIRDLVDEWFEHDLLKAAICARAVFGNFAGPRSPGTAGMWLQRLGEDPAPAGSSVTARGGPGALAHAVLSQFQSAGGTVRVDARVSRITTSQDRVGRVVLENGDEIRARAVVSTLDPQQTFLRLIEPEDLAPSFLDRARHYRARGVTAKINLALAGLPEFLALKGDPVLLRGRILIAPSADYLERAFDAAKYGQWSPEPWLEVSMPSIVDPSLAPDGQHVMSIYVHFAPRRLRDTQWTDSRAGLYATTIKVLEQYAPGLDSFVLSAEVITPEDLERTWGYSGGHIFHGEPALDQSWVARPFLGWSQYRTPIQGLYLAGAGTHPGGGLTGGSGLLAARTVLRDLKKRTRG